MWKARLPFRIVGQRSFSGHQLRLFFDDSNKWGEIKMRMIFPVPSRKGHNLANGEQHTMRRHLSNRLSALNTNDAGVEAVNEQNIMHHAGHGPDHLGDKGRIAKRSAAREPLSISVEVVLVCWQRARIFNMHRGSGKIRRI